MVLLLSSCNRECVGLNNIFIWFSIGLILVFLGLKLVLLGLASSLVVVWPAIPFWSCWCSLGRAINRMSAKVVQKVSISAFLSPHSHLLSSAAHFLSNTLSLTLNHSLISGVCLTHIICLQYY